ncbi:hypothetical protein HME9302_00560 [Alteripontixanthobacter maritimus]|uniref:Uncharacterized protein n=1 Tax=Alteripontixanthobacter maritimus TaxID=2161824 RepID=A0A369Q3A4_9SPHN|nr:hypothetical protein HME9302_00560 [Alteripontixanthobacter maritimus]
MRTGTRSTESGLAEGRIAVGDAGGVTVPVSGAAGADGCGAGTLVSGEGRGAGRGASFGALSAGMAARLRRAITTPATTAASAMARPSNQGHSGLSPSCCRGVSFDDASPGTAGGVVIGRSPVTPDCADGSAGSWGSGVAVFGSGSVRWGRAGAGVTVAGCGRRVARTSGCAVAPVAGGSLRTGAGVAPGVVVGVLVGMGVAVRAGAGAGVAVGVAIGDDGRVRTGFSGSIGP